MKPSPLRDTIECVTLGHDDRPPLLPRRQFPMEAFEPMMPLPETLISKDGKPITSPERDRDRMFEDRILRNLSGRGWVTRDEFGWTSDERTIDRLVTKLVRTGVIERRGVSPACEYRYRSRAQLMEALKRGE